MTQNFVNILNAPIASSGDLVESGGSVKITGLSPYKLNLVNSCTVQRSTTEELQVWTAAMTAGVANTVSFSIEQVVNQMRSLRTFSFEQTTSTTAANLLSAVNGFFGATATDGGAYVTASWGSVKYKAVISSTLLTLTISQVSGEAFPTVSNALNTTVSSSMSLTLATQANVDATAINFKVTAGHGLATGALVSVGTLTGQTAANDKVCRVVISSSTNFTLQDPITGTFYNASGTGSAVGTVTVIATPAFGTAAFVNADASANNSTQTATVTANNYSLVTIESGTNGGELPNLSTRTAPIHWWISEDTNGLLLLGSIASSYLA
jgi:hypothetical protein